MLYEEGLDIQDRQCAVQLPHDFMELMQEPILTCWGGQLIKQPNLVNFLYFLLAEQGHLLWVNSQVLELCDVRRKFPLLPSPRGGD
jgi:hypothetical protein